MMTVLNKDDVYLSGLICVLADISSMCVGEIAMGYKIDAGCIGQMIYEATGMTQPELAEYQANHLV
jgi:hypothetical protein